MTSPSSPLTNTPSFISSQNSNSPTTPRTKKLTKTLSSPISRHHLYRKCTKEYNTTTPVKRKITLYSNNLSPSVQTSSTSPADLEKQKAMTVEHAYMRIQIFYVTVVSLYQLAKRTNGTIRENLAVKIYGARLQHGQGQSGMHAAHVSAGAGLSDRLKKILTEEILDEKEITPKKKNILLNRGFNEEQLGQLIDLTVDPSAFLQFFYEIWPSQGRQPESILENTDVGVVTSGTTTEVPRIVNLVCDKRLENVVRNTMCDLYTEVLQGILTPEEATIRYHGMVKKHFETAIPNIEQRISDLKTYAENLKFFNGYSKQRPTNDDSWEVIITALIATKRRLRANNHKGSPTVLFKNIGNLFQKSKKIKTSELILKIKTRVKEKYDQIIEQVQEKKEKLEQVLQFTICENRGTVLPNFELLKRTNYSAPENQEPKDPPKKRSISSSVSTDETPNETASGSATEGAQETPIITEIQNISFAAAPELSNVKNRKKQLLMTGEEGENSAPTASS